MKFIRVHSVNADAANCGYCRIKQVGLREHHSNSLIFAKTQNQLNYHNMSVQFNTKLVIAQISYLHAGSFSPKQVSTFASD